MKKLLGIVVLSLLLSWNAYADDKPGRFFQDQSDVTDQPQVHFIYLLNKDSEDNEWDINGKMEKELMAANEKVYKM